MKVPFRLPNLPGVTTFLLNSPNRRASFFEQEQARRTEIRKLLAEYFPPMYVRAVPSVAQRAAQIVADGGVLHVPLPVSFR